MLRLIEKLKSDDIRVTANHFTGKTVFVGHKLSQVALLGFYQLRLFVHVVFAETYRESRLGRIGFRITGSPPGDWRQNGFDTPFLQAHHQIIEQFHIFVIKHVALFICDKFVPDVDPVCIQFQTGNMVHIHIDGRFMVNATAGNGAIAVGKRRAVVNAEQIHRLTTGPQQFAV